MNTSKELREFKPDIKTVEEYDKLISEKLNKAHPELFLVGNREGEEGKVIDNYVVDEYERTVKQLEKEKKTRQKKLNLEIIKEEEEHKEDNF